MKQVHVLILSFFLAGSFRPSSAQTSMYQLIRNDLMLARDQYLLLEKNTPDSLMPRYFDPAGKGNVTSDTKWWCSGFFPASLWKIYSFTGDTAIWRIALKRLALQEKEKYYTGNHDLGFMIYCPFGNALRLTGDTAYREVIVTAAKSLCTRYRPSIRSIQSWNASEKLKCPVIIDNMMNLELLCRASEISGDPRYHAIAVQHANSTLANHFRADHSSYHVLDYDTATGTIIRKLTWQGAADSSAWARGQSWGLYGFTMMYRFTRDTNYLRQAEAIAGYLLDHPRLPADGIPFWDYDAPGIPGTYRDASAGAIMASALLELAQYSRARNGKKYVAAAEKILRTLSSPAYLSAPGENGGFLLKHSVGSLPHRSEVDVSLTYADYYFIEALLRYRDWYLRKP